MKKRVFISALLLLVFVFVLFAAQMHKTHFLTWAGNSYLESALYSRNLVAATGKDTSKVFMLAIDENSHQLSKRYVEAITTAFYGTEGTNTDSMFNVIYLDLANYKDSNGNWRWYPWDNSTGAYDTLSSATTDTAAIAKQIKKITSFPHARAARFRVIANAASGDTSIVGGTVGLTYEK